MVITVPKLIGHQNVKCHILDMTKLFCQSLDKLVLLLERFNVTKVTSTKVWDPGGLQLYNKQTSNARRFRTVHPT